MVADGCGHGVQAHLVLLLCRRPALGADLVELALEHLDIDHGGVGVALQGAAEQVAQDRRAGEGQQHLATGRRVRRRALADPVVHGDGGRASNFADVDDPVAVQDGHVHRLPDVRGQRLTGLAALVREVALDGQGACQPYDAEAEAVLAPVGQLLDQATGLQHCDQPGSSGLVHAELERDLGDARHPTLRQDLQDRDGAVD